MIAVVFTKATISLKLSVSFNNHITGIQISNETRKAVLQNIKQSL